MGGCMPKAKKPTRKTARQVPIAIYLGTPEIKRTRIDALDALAEQHGVNRSQLIQDIADGKLRITRPD